MNAQERLVALRKLFEQNIDAFIIPSSDAHMSEYVAECDMRRGWISGFDGSAGTVVVTKDKALLWTDGRYHLQAENQLSKEWTLMKSGEQGVPSMKDWLADNMVPNSRVGIYAQVTGISSYNRIHESVSKKKIEVVCVNDLVVKCWGDERPAIPSEPIICLTDEYTGENSASKIARVRAQLKENNVHSLMVTALDEVAWLFNIRGADIPYNPVFFSYAIVSDDRVRLYVDDKKLSEDVRTHIGPAVEIFPYETFFSDCQKLNTDLLDQKEDTSVEGGCRKVWMDPYSSNLALYQSFDYNLVVQKQSPLCLMKGVKNKTEVEGMRQAHIRDGAAVCSFFCWMEEQFKNSSDKTVGDEITVGDKLAKFRSEQKDFVGLSFETISASGPNAAIIHYAPSKATARAITDKEIFLLDSGAQYLDGTTDITRTVHFGQPTTFEINSFTRVLKGHIALASVVFPPNTTGMTLDLLARIPLWQVGLDYAHGTGHGVGAFLNVHEGPHGIYQVRSSSKQTPFQGGMSCTIEPGYYHAGAFGIRIENVFFVQEMETKHHFRGTKYFGFENITFVPLQRKMINLELLNKEEIQWINDYHKLCFDKVSPLLTGKSLQWLKKETKEIVKQQTSTATTTTTTTTTTTPE